MGRSIKLGKKTILLASGLVLASGAIVGASLIVSGFTPTIGEETVYKFEVNGASFGTLDTTSAEASSSLVRSGDYAYTFYSYGCVVDKGSTYISVSDDGYIFNGSKLTSLQSVSVSYSGSGTLYAARGWYSHPYEEEPAVVDNPYYDITWQQGTWATVTSGTAIDLSSTNPNYLKLQAEGEVTIESIVYSYSCIADNSVSGSSFRLISPEPTIGEEAFGDEDVLWAKVSFDGGTTSTLSAMTKNSDGTWYVDLRNVSYTCQADDLFEYAFYLGTSTSEEADLVEPSAGAGSDGYWSYRLAQGQTEHTADTAPAFPGSSSITVTFSCDITMPDGDESKKWPDLRWSTLPKYSASTWDQEGQFGIDNDGSTKSSVFNAGTTYYFLVYYWYNNSDYFGLPSASSDSPFDFTPTGDCTVTLSGSLSKSGYNEFTFSVA